ncbi:MAG: hypothetical protein DWQ05_07335 [Calditrichaeota bacterium]|nr:MAG: hypothetical protein DWQ05_07335 [Calditrichota bacterium]
MRISKILILLAVFVVFGCENKDDHMAEKADAHDSMAEVAGKGEKLIYYTCPMESHKHIHSKEAGKCPECQMEMVAGVVTSDEQKEYYGCPMLTHSHVRKEEAGKCEECGMFLKPMRLVKNTEM